jgi:hypothetical protein
VEVDFRNSIKPERLEPLYGHAAAMACTTIFVPVLWSQVERSAGRFDFRFVDRQIDLASRHGLKLGLLWFGTNRGGSAAFYNLPGSDGSSGSTIQVPADVFEDQATYRRAAGPEGSVPYAFCPTCPATLAREVAAYAAFMRHLATTDVSRTVVLVQVENEVSTPEVGRLEFPDRCFCPACTQRQSVSGLTDRQFSDRSYGNYVAALVEAGAKEYPIPSYVNFVCRPRPGEDIACYLEQAPHLASCGPDIYAADTSSFRRALASFAVGRNVPLVAETSSDTKDPSDRTIWYAVCGGGAVGFVQWAIDCAYGDGAWEPGYSYRTPLVDSAGAWSSQAWRMRDELSVLAAVMGPLCATRGTDRLQWFVAEGSPLSLKVTLPGVHGRIDAGPEGRGLLALRDSGDVILAGHGFTVLLDATGPATAARGRWAGSVFLPEGDPVRLSAPGGSLRIPVENPAVVRVQW